MLIKVERLPAMASPSLTSPIPVNAKVLPNARRMMPINMMQRCSVMAQATCHLKWSG